MKKVIIATVTAKPDCADAIITRANALVTATRAESGCESYDFVRDIENPCVFRFIEVWRDQAAVDAHFATPHFQAFGPQLDGLIAAPLEVTIYDIAAEKKA